MAFNHDTIYAPDFTGYLCLSHTTQVYYLVINLLVVAPSEEITQHTPIGFTLLDQMFTEAGLKDKVSDSQTTAERLRRSLIYLSRRFPRRLRIQWVEPLSLRGLYVKFRYRLRTYPVVLMQSSGEFRILTGDEIKQLADHVVEMLSKPINFDNDS